MKNDKFWIIHPVKTKVEYIPISGLVDEKDGIRFEIIKSCDTKAQAIQQAEEIISGGEWVFIHDVENHIDFYQKYQWEHKEIE